MYKSPITVMFEDTLNKIRDMTDEQIYKAVLNTEIKIDKEELEKALLHDREQYNKGYADGYFYGINECVDLIYNRREEILKERNKKQ